MVKVTIDIPEEVIVSLAWDAGWREENEEEERTKSQAARERMIRFLRHIVKQKRLNDRSSVDAEDVTISVE